LSLRVRLTPEAQADLDEAQDWYDTASPGLGAEFLDAVESTLRLLRTGPKLRRS
jgi:plasmid stabilization system protein ParE